MNPYEPTTEEMRRDRCRKCTRDGFISGMLSGIFATLIFVVLIHATIGVQI